MIVAVLTGLLCGLTAVALIRPFLRTRRLAGPGATAGTPDTPTPLHLLRQLRDLDDDLAAGRILEVDHQRLRGALEREAAAALRADGAATVTGRAPVAVKRDRAAAPLSARARRTRRGVGLAVAALAVVGVTALLLGAVDQRTPSAQATGGGPTGAPSAAAASGAPSRLTARQLAGVEAAVNAVKSHPKQASSHVELARAYSQARQPQLAAIEYLAATRLDPGNPEANIALAMVAFKAGSPRQADALVSRAIAEHPGYAEALYTRGMIRAMGLRRPAAATRDLKAYQHAAPLGSHRTTVATVLALLASGAIK